MRKARVLLLCGAAALMAVLAVALGASAALCSVNATMTPGERIAEITENISDAVTFDGNLSLVKPMGGTGTIHLTITVSMGWPATTSPASMAAGTPTLFNASFNATVFVPAGESASNIGQVTVTFEAVAGAETCDGDSVQGIVTPHPYFGPYRVSLGHGGFFAENSRSAFTLQAHVYREANVRDQPALVRIRVLGPPGLLIDAPEEVLVSWQPDGENSGNVTIHMDARAVAQGHYEIQVYPVSVGKATYGPEYGDTVFLFVRDPPFDWGLTLGMGGAAAATVAVAAVVLRWKRG